jgi:hypothetical protein
MLLVLRELGEKPNRLVDLTDAIPLRFKIPAQIGNSERWLLDTPLRQVNK